MNSIPASFFPNRIVPAGMISIRCSLVLSDATAPTSLGFGSVKVSAELLPPTLFTTPAKSSFVNHIPVKRGDNFPDFKISSNRFSVAAGDSFIVMPPWVVSVFAWFSSIIIAPRMSKSADCNSRGSDIPETIRESDESSPNHFVREIKAVLHSSIVAFSPIWNDCSDLAKAFTCSLRAGLFRDVIGLSVFLFW